MTKQDYLTESSTADIIRYISEDTGRDYERAMELFYSSATFEKLCDPETGLYLESPAYVYGIFEDELKFGRIVQREI